MEGAQFAACLFSSLSKKRPPIHSYRKSEQHTDRYFPTVCMLFFLLYRLFRRSLVSAAVSLPCTDVKGERFFGLNTLCLQRKILPETARPPDLFTFNEVCTNFMDGEEAGGCEIVIGCQSRNVCGFGFSFPSVCPFPLRFFLPLSWHTLVW